MVIPDKGDWSRFHRIKEDLSRFPVSQINDRIAQLKHDGEPSTVIDLLENYFKLPEPPVLKAGSRLCNRYTIKRKIGEGGMGFVYAAIQEYTQQEVAIKVIHPSLVSPRLTKRFREEIRTLGRLEHPHIVRIFDADNHRDLPSGNETLFYAMQLVDGQSLTKWIESSNPSVESRLECFVQICEAVHYAHQNGIVHRDLKPDNVLVDKQGRPAVLDFGLAQIADPASEQPPDEQASGDDTRWLVAGTPAFMSPERWDGEPGGPASDVFAMGVLLHEMLTETRPWNLPKNASLNDLRTAICEFSPGELKGKRGLNRVSIKLIGAMLATDPDGRPDTPMDVAVVIRDVLKRRRIVRRARMTAPVWGSILVALVSILITKSFDAHREANRKRSELLLAQATSINRQRNRIDSWERVAALLPADPELRHSQDAWRDAALEARSNWNLRWELPVMLPAGFHLSAVDRTGNRFFGHTENGSSEVIQRTDLHRTTHTVPTASGIVRARFRPGDTEIVFLQEDGELRTFNWTSGQVRILDPKTDPDAEFEFSPDGRYFAYSRRTAAASEPNSEMLSEVCVLDTTDWKHIRTLIGRGETVDPDGYVPNWTRATGGIAFSPDGRFLATWSNASQNVPVWRVKNGELALYAGHPDVIEFASWQPKEGAHELAIVRKDGEVVSWRLSTERTNVVSRTPDGSFSMRKTGFETIDQLAWTRSANGLIAVDERNSEIHLILPGRPSDFPKPQLVARYPNGFQWVSNGRLQETPNGPQWERPELEPPIRRSTQIAGVAPLSLSFSADEQVLAVADSKTIVFLSTSNLSELARAENMAINGPIMFDNLTGDLWVYEKQHGAVRWHHTRTNSAMEFWRPRTGTRNSVGEVAAMGGQVAISRGLQIYAGPAALVRPRQFGVGDFRVAEVPESLMIDLLGKSVGVIWVNPVRGALWQQTNDIWRLTFRTTNSVILTSLPGWNGTNLISVPVHLQRTVEEKSARSETPHWAEGTLLTPAANLPLVVSSIDQNRGIHVDRLGSGHCQHIGIFPMQNADGRRAVSVAISPNGSFIVAANRDGTIEFWSLRPILEHLDTMQLGFPEIASNIGDQNAAPVTHLKIVENN